MDRVAAGELTLEEAKSSPDWHVLSNFLGFESFRVATHRIPMRAGDRLLLCTDGLSNMLTDAQITELLTGGGPSDVSNALITAATVRWPRQHLVGGRRDRQLIPAASAARILGAAIR